MTIDLIIAALLLSSSLLFAAGRHEAGRVKRTPWCWKHSRGYRWYMDGSRDCSECVAERIADIWRQGGNLREDI